MDDGKYTFQLHEDGWSIEVLRHREPWITIQQGHRAIFALMQHAALQHVPRAIEPVTQVIKNRTGVARWKSFGWPVIAEHSDLYELQRQVAKAVNPGLHGQGGEEKG